MPYQSHFSQFDRPNNIWWGIHIVTVGRTAGYMTFHLYNAYVFREISGKESFVIGLWECWQVENISVVSQVKEWNARQLLRLRGAREAALRHTNAISRRFIQNLFKPPLLSYSNIVTGAGRKVGWESRKGNRWRVQYVLGKLEGKRWIWRLR